MAVFKNAEIRQGDRVIRVNVEVDSSVPITGPSAGTVEWGGVLRPPNNTGLMFDESYVLILPGFAPAEIMITDEANPVDGSVTFKGLGDLPKAVQSQHVQNAK